MLDKMELAHMLEVSQDMVTPQCYKGICFLGNSMARALRTVKSHNDQEATKPLGYRTSAMSSATRAFYICLIQITIQIVLNLDLLDSILEAVRILENHESTQFIVLRLFGQFHGYLILLDWMFCPFSGDGLPDCSKTQAKCPGFRRLPSRRVLTHGLITTWPWFWSLNFI